jgi:hypothetical protein
VTEPVRCPLVDELPPDLALGLLMGVERADALAHLSRCDDCRSAVEELADVADELLLLAPSVPPPPGFESAVLGVVAPDASAGSAHPDGPDRRVSGRWKAVIGLTVVAAALIAFVVGVVARPDDEGSRMAVMVATAGGDEVGSVSIDGRDPAWILVSMPGWTDWLDDSEPVDYKLRLDLDDGGQVELTGVHLASDGSWGGTTALDPSSIEAASIIDESGRTMCSGPFT